MTRGNQRDKAREKTNKENAKKKSANSLTGGEFQRKKENDAAIMRAKQANANSKTSDTGTKKK